MSRRTQQPRTPEVEMSEAPPGSDRWYGRPTWHGIIPLVMGLAVMGLGLHAEDLKLTIGGGLHTLAMSIYTASLFRTYRAGDGGLLVRGVIRTRTYPWEEVQAVVKGSKGGHRVLTSRGEVTLSPRIVDGEQLIQQIERGANVEAKSIATYAGKDCRQEFTACCVRFVLGVFLFVAVCLVILVLVNASSDSSRPTFSSTPTAFKIPDKVPDEREENVVPLTALIGLPILLLAMGVLQYFTLRCPNCSTVQLRLKNICPSCQAVLRE